MTFIACAAMLTSAVAFTGCKSENEPQQRAPEVVTDIAISLPGQLGNGARRMPGRTVQTAGYDDFYANGGMKSIQLIPFAAKAAVTSESKRHGDDINLGTISTGEGTDMGVANETGKGRNKVFTNAKVPVGTSSFLFYGESAKSSENKFESGSLNAALTGQPDAINFSLTPITTSAAVVEDASYTGLIAYLNHIANAKDGITPAAKSWKEYTAEMNEGYYELFQTYSTAKVLSSFGIERMLTDLYQNMKLNTAETDTLARSIRDSIKTAKWASVSGEGVVTLNDNDGGVNYTNIPAKWKLPQGALSITYNSEGKKFVGNAASAFGTGEDIVAPAGIQYYVYPPTLWYFANTKIKTSNTTQADNYAEGTPWATILSGYTSGNSVTSKTRSIALTDTIQYAVARLDVKVAIGGEGGYLVDNNPLGGDATHVSNPGGGYEVTAVLVGGQKNVLFDFQPNTLSDAYVIYDSLMTTDNLMYASTSWSTTNSTLVLETVKDADQYIAIELRNTGDDFYGVGSQLVPAGARFYMVGKLGASAASETGNKVFKQDYTTTAQLTIQDLTKAYSTIPDLKAPALEVGLLVDLSWKAGHTYEVNL